MKLARVAFMVLTLVGCNFLHTGAQQTSAIPQGAGKSTWQKEVETLPAEILTFAETIQGKDSKAVHRLIRQRFGKAVRNVGSGISIEQWDAAGGVLTFHPVVGPSFQLTGKPSIRLMRTTNLVRENLFGSYEMTTLPIAGTRYWLGNVTVSKELHYHYTDSGQNLSERSGQQANFFMLHPDGILRVEYPADITPDSHLEETADGTTVITLTFVASDGNARETYTIVSERSSRQLVFSGEGQIAFEMNKGWENYWR